jgi:transcriptional regulator with GAF, ATPase, and Fis domain
MAITVMGPTLSATYERVARLAPSNLSVLITGETGCGKELIANELHLRSPRASRPLVAINCAALHANLVESELFGHQKGAFSGAVGVQIGKIEAANGSTLFLDEVGELPIQIQAKFLRVLEAQQLTRLGDIRPRAVDVRIVAATNRDLEREIDEGRFRRDLYFRLAAAEVHLPPLRERTGDVAALARAFIAETCEAVGRGPMRISSEALSLLEGHDWPGNIRELKNLMHYVVAVAQEDIVRPEDIATRLQSNAVMTGRPGEHVPPAPASPIERQARFRPLAEEIRALEVTRIRQALEATHGNATQAAKLLSMPSRTFFEKAKLHGLGRSGPPIYARQTSPTRTQVDRAIWDEETTAVDIKIKRKD